MVNRTPKDIMIRPEERISLFVNENEEFIEWNNNNA